VPIILPELVLLTLLWVLGGLTGLMLVIITTGAWLQIRRDRMVRFRIACNRRWEEEIVAYLYQEPRNEQAFQGMEAREQRLFVPFLARILGVLSGGEAEVIRNLYHQLRLERGLTERLRARAAKTRGLAALEVGHFRVQELYPDLRVLLDDPVPHVAHAAACSLASSQDLQYAQPVLRWMHTQDTFQQDRLIWILESFGPDLLPWMENRMDNAREPDPLSQELYLLLVGSFRNHSSVSRVMDLLHSGPLDVQAAALKALGLLGNPESFTEVLPFAGREEWVLRGQVAKILGVLGGSEAIPHLTTLMRDPVYDVRRNAAYALSQLGTSGIQALEWMSMQENGDPFARDLASERLQWAHMRGR
jgi:hypothetical protein